MLYRWRFNWFPAYRGTGGRVTYIAADWREIRVRLPLSRRTRNYVGTIFGGSLYGALDPLYMIMLMQLLGPETVAQRLLFLEAGNSGAPAGLPDGRFDLAISTLAFSECHRSIQQGYLKTVLSRARCGYIHRNEISGFFGLKSLRLAEIEAALPAKLEIEKDDITYWYDRTDILSWDTSRTAVAA